MSGEVVVVPRAATGSPYVGLATRVISFAIDAAVINLVAIIVALGASLILSVVHIPHSLDPVLATIGGVVYVIGAIAYFVIFWCATGQTPGARVMKIRVVSSDWERVRARYAVLRCCGVILAVLPLFLGYASVLFDNRRRAFPDWLARTLVVEAPGMSIAAGRLEQRRAS